MLAVKYGVLFGFALALGSAPSPLSSGPGGFKSGDLFLHSAALTAPWSGNGGLLRINPFTGATQQILGPYYITDTTDTFAYDSWRDRLILSAELVGQTPDLWEVDASGNFASLGFSGQVMRNLAPTGDGRIYMQDSGGLAGDFKWIDAADSQHVLLNTTGTAPYQFDTTIDNFWAMVYDPGTNALFVAARWLYHVCPGGAPSVVSVHKIPLSQDGTKVAGPTSCSYYEVDPNGQVIPVGFSRGPAGMLVLVVDTNSDSSQPRMLFVDPATVSITVFATNGGYTGAATTDAGVYSQALGKTIVLDTFNNVLRAFAQGEVGPGTTLAATGVSLPSFISEKAALVEITGAAPNYGLTIGLDEISLTAGGTQHLSLNASPSLAGAIYLVVGSATGWNPPIPVDSVSVPLLIDGYTLFTLQNPSLPPLVQTLGLLNAQGQAAAQIALPPSSDPALAGILLYHAAIGVKPGFPVSWASNAVQLRLVP